MNIFNEITGRLPFYKDIKNCLLKGFTPCAVTGVSNICYGYRNLNATSAPEMTTMSRTEGFGLEVRRRSAPD